MYDLVSLALRKKCIVVRINVAKEEFINSHQNYKCEKPEDIKAYVENIVEWSKVLDSLYNELIEVDRQIDSITRGIYTAEGRSRLYEG